jgi:aldehyde dehydrogenase (NAD+)
MQVESFGPIGQVNSFSTEEEVLEKANDTEYGLYASVFTNDISRALKFAQEIESGVVVINGASPTAAVTMPYGGWKQSGIGYENGPEGLEMWTQIKTIFIPLQ